MAESGEFGGVLAAVDWVMGGGDVYGGLNQAGA